MYLETDPSGRDKRTPIVIINKAMSHPHSQAGSWAGIPASGKLVFVKANKHYKAVISLLFWERNRKSFLFICL